MRCGNSEVEPGIRGYYANDGDLPPKVQRPEPSGVRHEIRSYALSAGTCPPDSGSSRIHAREIEIS